MNQQEAQELASQLGVIWDAGAGDAVSLSFNDTLFSFGGWVGIDDALAFEVRIDKGVAICELLRDYWCRLWTDGIGKVHFTNSFSNEEERKSQEEFGSQLMEEFRKRAWLSGCPIECTATERMEWALWAKEERGLTDLKLMCI